VMIEKKYLEGIDVVSLDAGFTLIYPEPPVGHAYASMAARFGYQLPEREVHARFVKVWLERNASNRDLRADNAMADEARSYLWWKKIFIDSIGDMLAPADIEPVFQVCFEEYARGEYWAIYPDVLPLLSGLKERGCRLVVMSNWDRRLQKTMQDLGLTPLFEKVYISTLIGYAKPDPAVFHHIIADLGVPISSLLHIGDSLEEDIAAANSAGIRSLLIDRPARYTAQPVQVPVLSSLAQVLD